MIKTLKNLLKQDKERYSVPRKVQDVIISYSTMWMNTVNGTRRQNPRGSL